MRLWAPSCVPFVTRGNTDRTINKSAYMRCSETNFESHVPGEGEALTTTEQLATVLATGGTGRGQAWPGWPRRQDAMPGSGLNN